MRFGSYWNVLIRSGQLDPDALADFVDRIIVEAVAAAPAPQQGIVPAPET